MFFPTQEILSTKTFNPRVPPFVIQVSLSKLFSKICTRTLKY
ncbi:hypothetical protein MtrunA17_Chr8g0364401 [Medicago truncatula]|uniref:Uncharacterized protein n=1 Tax=Medicago truncatula TaxID=3880 RepID=A0A396GJI3_MEDTR|nr:hypothetical protein MtrunA17_Chr8g0364401 [Medicago truncatula]